MWFTKRICRFCGKCGAKHNVFRLVCTNATLTGRIGYCICIGRTPWFTSITCPCRCCIAHTIWTGVSQVCHAKHVGTNVIVIASNITKERSRNIGRTCLPICYGGQASATIKSVRKHARCRPRYPGKQILWYRCYWCASKCAIKQTVCHTRYPGK